MSTSRFRFSREESSIVARNAWPKMVMLSSLGSYPRWCGRRIVSCKTLAFGRTVDTEVSIRLTLRYYTPPSKLLDENLIVSNKCMPGDHNNMASMYNLSISKRRMLGQLSIGLRNCMYSLLSAQMSQRYRIPPVLVFAIAIVALPGGGQHQRVQQPESSPCAQSSLDFHGARSLLIVAALLAGPVLPSHNDKNLPLRNTITTRSPIT